MRFPIDSFFRTLDAGFKGFFILGNPRHISHFARVNGKTNAGSVLFLLNERGTEGILNQLARAACRLIDKLRGCGIGEIVIATGRRRKISLAATLGFKRAGASGVLTYHALTAARVLQG